MTIPTAPPSGFRDFSPQDCALRARAVELISKTYRSFGFQQIATSAVEDLQVLLGKGGGENEKLIFKLLKRGESLERAKAEGGELTDMGLRFDLTLPLARYYSKYGSQLPHPFKAFHIGPVWRAERAQKGRYREFYQCDADIIGADSVSAEVDVISAILAAFSAMGVSGVTVKLNDRRLLYAHLEKSGVPEAQRGQACVLLDKLDKVERAQIQAELEQLCGAAAASALLSPVQIEDTRLQEIARLVGPAVELDPMLVRGFDYYTSTVFEFRHPKFGGSVGGGGRYDKLTEKFGGQPVPAVGGSIGFERLMLLLDEQTETGPDYVVTVFSEELREKTLALARTLREAGLSVDVYPGGGKLKQQFKYADSKKASYAVVMGPDEAARGEFKVKDLKTGEERPVSLSDAVGLGGRVRAGQQQL